MKKSDIKNMPVFFDRYINLVDDLDVIVALERYATIESILDRSTCHALDGIRYAPGKWTIKDILLHLTDNERVQSYRALRFARKDTTTLHGYDEELFARNGNAENRTIDDLIEEFRLARESTLALYRSFTDEMLQQEGYAFKSQISVLAIAFVLVGHPIHHANVIRERYLPLIKQ